MVYPDMSASSPCSPDDVSEQDLAAVEVALRHLERRNRERALLKMVVEWFFVLRMVKEVERSFLQTRNRETLQAKHRAILGGMMGFGEILAAETEGLAETELKGTGYSRESLVANVRYLREKYEQWFVPLDPQTANRVWGKLLDERPAAPA
jgi:hypothetical protein